MTLIWLMRLWVKEAFIGFFRNLGWNVSAIMISSVCMIFFLSSYVAGENASHFSKELGEKVEIRVDLLTDISDGEHAKIQKELEANSKVKSVTYVSKDEAYNKVRDQMGEDASVLDVLDTNPFPARFIIRLHNPEEVAVFANYVEGLGVAETVQYGEGYVEKMLTGTKVLSQIGYYFTAAFTLLALYIVGSVIKMNITQRKGEISIKKLTGSGMFTVRFPFVLEALIITGVASVLSYYFFVFAYEYAVKLLGDFIPYIQLIELGTVTETLVYLLAGLSLLIGVLGSVTSTKQLLQKQ
ncbi:hypothetical protein IMZ31_21235 (plasmid) [Pontibacillus sp. ALD_SL1]|uniref:permease-like cell division protein FtsX n=1 Tax=Pontibacillus sp. ALD_SL1 TaxID=2777185 RepID=UPI001A956613|nr:permease-like cell division protein FtsX [Pontibacillus sp. ALD_SL1]QST03075.1 hypothetical protein IMZ31_21235 [Pontibacillus sp. ALD_SL1]